MMRADVAHGSLSQHQTSRCANAWRELRLHCWALEEKQADGPSNGVLRARNSVRGVVVHGSEVYLEGEFTARSGLLNEFMEWLKILFETTSSCKELSPF